MGGKPKPNIVLMSTALNALTIYFFFSKNFSVVPENYFGFIRSQETWTFSWSCTLSNEQNKRVSSHKCFLCKKKKSV